MRRRSGFTLVEVLVAMALILFIMSILASAFGSATQTVSDLKSAGDLAEKLRGAATVIKRDLEAPHFTDGTVPPSHLSDPTFWNRLNTGAVPVGFFRIFEAQPPVYEASDLDNIPCYHQTTTALAYTIALSGARRSDFMSAFLPQGSPLLASNDAVLGPPDERYADSPNTTSPTIYTSQYAEVALFVAPNVNAAGIQDTTDNVAPSGSQPLFALYRRQFLTVPANWTPASPVSAAQPLGNPSYIEVSKMANVGANLVFNSVQSLSLPVHRFGMQRTAPAGVYQAPQLNPNGYNTMGMEDASYQAADLLVTDVLSFDVRVLIAGDSEFRDLSDPVVQQFSGKNATFGNGPPYVFDTWTNQKDATLGVDYSTWNVAGTAVSAPLYQTAGANPTQIIIKAIQIQLRVWDFKTKKTRQVTIVQQM